MQQDKALALGAIAVNVSAVKIGDAAEFMLDNGWLVLETGPCRGTNRISERTMIVMPDAENKKPQCQIAADRMRRTVERTYGVAQ